MQKTQLINNMILFLASLPPAAYTALQAVYRKYEEAKKTTKHSKPDCRGSNFRELRNLDSTTVQTMLQQVATGDLMLATSIYAGQFDSISHRILHLHVEKDKDRVNYEDPIVTFASKWVAQQVYDEAEHESVLSLINVMSKAARHPPLQGLCGQIFESFCHTQLSSGRTFTVKSLTSETTIPEVWKCSKRDTFRDLIEAELSENTYYVPENPNFESVDAVVPPDTAVQITVSSKHPVKMRGLQYVKAALGCQELKLYFAVPENIYESFQKQPYHTQKGTEWKKNVTGISQWAVCVPIKTQP